MMRGKNTEMNIRRSAAVLICLPILLLPLGIRAEEEAQPDSAAQEPVIVSSGESEGAETGDAEDPGAEGTSLETALSSARAVFLNHLELWYQDVRDEALALPNETYRDLAEHAEDYKTFESVLNAAMARAMMSCMADLSTSFREMDLQILGFELPSDRIGWKRLAAIIRSYRDRTPEAVLSCFSLSLVPNESRESYKLCIGYEGLDGAYPAGTRKQVMNAKFCTAYLNTVYDDSGTEKPVLRDSLPEDYVSKLIHPVPGGLIKNGWRLPRSNATRYHMGTDIKVNSRTRIRSVTDGTVLYRGYLDIPGNYVVIRDPEGYEYHYYHMFNLSKYVKEGDTVRKGDIIGLVGNTGNSVANHLHLAIITPEPEYRYLNPYDIFLQAGLNPIRIDEEAAEEPEEE